MAPQTDLRPAGFTGKLMLPESMTLHHVGVLVRNMEEAQACYRQLGAAIGEAVTVSSQGVRVCFAKLSGSVAIELVEPSETGLAAGLLKRGFSYYHTGFLVTDFEEALESLKACNFVLFGSFESEAFGGRRCAFLMSPVRHLIEIIEQDKYEHR